MQERYHNYILRKLREEREEELTDEQMVEHLRTHAHWTTTRPWKQIADRLEELSEKSGSKK